MEGVRAGSVNYTVALIKWTVGFDLARFISGGQSRKTKNKTDVFNVIRLNTLSV